MDADYIYNNVCVDAGWTCPVLDSIKYVRNIPDIHNKASIKQEVKNSHRLVGIFFIREYIYTTRMVLKSMARVSQSRALLIQHMSMINLD